MRDLSQEPHIVALIPAWNEEASIGGTIRSIKAQTRVPDRIVVVPNNTTDRTADVALLEGADIIEFPGFNPEKKAGALNYGLTQLASELDRFENSCVLVMDADTALDPDFVQTAANCLYQDESIGAVGSIFTGRTTKSFLGNLQRMEFERYGIQIRHRPEAYVLSGTASLFRWPTLKAVKAARLSGRLGGGRDFYDTVSVTEDNEITLAILSLGYFCPTCGVESTTDVMEDATSLYSQRKRWYVGALQNIRSYGRTMPVWMRLTYWRQQLGILLSLLITPVLLVSFFLWLLTGADVAPFLLYINVVLMPAYILVKTLTVWRLGWRSRLIALAFIPEIIYSQFLVMVYALSVLAFLRGTGNQWVHT